MSRSRAAGARGLFVTQHHVNTLGLDTYRWPKNRPMSVPVGSEPLEAAWATAASEYPRNIEVLWSVGFRGQNDYPFWQDDPNAPTTDEGRAGIIRSAIDTQMAIVTSFGRIRRSDERLAGGRDVHPRGRARTFPMGSR